VDARGEGLGSLGGLASGKTATLPFIKWLVSALRTRSPTKEEKMRIIARLVTPLIIGVAAGCSTSGQFKVPANTTLYLEERPTEVSADGLVTTRPFFWTSAPGVHYRLEKDGVTIERGRVPSQFRPVSIFFPPYALIYWPMGFRSDLTYDLVNSVNVTVTHRGPQNTPVRAPASGR
jgi:hypothetical protein